MLTPPADNQTLQTFANMTMPEECPANVTQCVVLLFLNEESGMDKQVSGGCYDPTALWIISQEVMCEPNDPSIKVSLDGSFIYTCCDDSVCNTGGLLDNPDARELFEPDCTTVDAIQCVEDYVETYGCLLENIRIINVTGDNCARFLRPGVSCLEATCAGCECDRPGGPSPQCEDKCAGVVLASLPAGEDDFVAPGCNSDDIADGSCDIFCMVKDGFFDGGDCNSEAAGRARNHLLRLVARSDDDRDGMLSADEADAMDPRIDGMKFNKYDLDMDDYLDWYEVGLALREVTMLDDVDNMDMPAATFMEETAINILQLVDRNLNGRADKMELDVLFDLSDDQFDMMAGMMGEGMPPRDDGMPLPMEVTAFQIMKTLNIVSSGLMGMDMIDEVDVKLAVMTAVSLSDYSGDRMLSMGEAKMLRLSERMFHEIDENDDDMISGDELYDAIKEAGKYGCMGFQSLDMQEGDIKYKAAPLRFPDGMCNILIMPEWNYEGKDVEYEPPVHVSANSLRRKKTVRPKPPTLHNRDALNVQVRRKAMLEVKSKNVGLKSKKTSARLTKLLSPRHSSSRRLLQASPGDPFDTTMLDPDVTYPFVVSLQTPQKSCSTDLYLDSCDIGTPGILVPPWMLYDALMADSSSVHFDDNSCLRAGDFGDIASMVDDGPLDIITKDDLTAAAWDDLEGSFNATTAANPLQFSILDSPFPYEDFQALAEFLFPDGVNFRTAVGIVCQNETDLSDAFWTAFPAPCVDEASVSSYVSAIYDSGPGTTTISDYVGNILGQMLNDCNATGPIRRRLMADDEPRNAPVDVEYGDMFQYCSGVLIDKEWVLTSAFCVGDDVDSVVSHDQVYLGGKNGTSGKPYGVEKVLVHPGFKTVGHEMYDMREYDVALIKLAMPVEEILPVRMYDGKDLGYSDCHQLMVKAIGFPEMGERGAAELEWTPNRECDKEKTEELGYPGSVKPSMLCAKGANSTSDELKFMDLGSPLIAKPADLVVNVSYMLIGIASSKEEGRHFFARVSAIRQWALSVIGRHPHKDLTVVINELQLGDDDDDTQLEWFQGPSQTAPCEDCKIEECDIETGVYKDMRAGAMTFSIQGGADWEFEAELSIMGCGTECDAQMRRAESMGCPKPPGTDDPRESMPPCAMCTLDADWEHITDMAKHGKSFTGGLGAKAVHTFHKHYGVWVCVRDWDVTEQLACGAKPGEIVCFRYNEKDEMFDYYGMNAELMLVKEEQAEEAMEKELDQMATLDA